VISRYAYSGLRYREILIESLSSIAVMYAYTTGVYNPLTYVFCAAYFMFRFIAYRYWNTGGFVAWAVYGLMLLVFMLMIWEMMT